MVPIDTDLKFLSGVGPARAELLAKELGLRTLDDLIHFFPYRYLDRSRFYKIAEIDSTTSYIQVKGKITGYQITGEGRAKRLIAHFTDGGDTIDLIFFKGYQYITERYRVGTEYVVFGKPNCFNHTFSFVHPDIELPDPSRQVGFMPLYHTSEKLKNKYITSKTIQKYVYEAIRSTEVRVNETLPQDLIAKCQLMPLRNALVAIHFPRSAKELENARLRLKFEELFYIQLSILRQSSLHRNKYKGVVFEKVGGYFNDFYKKCLPFDLTNAQKRVLREIREDTRTGRQMNRLLQGDVGSGKTIVALMSMLLAVDNGCQTCILAPTEILAAQHYESISHMVEPLQLQVRLLTGSTKKKERETLHESLRDGSLQILVGTHAVLEDEVQFKNLGFVVIDEQHRFGVQQRSRMWLKNAVPPHVLVMTATPIPRTLAMTVYGDLDVSVIDELPPGRKPIKTMHVFENNRERLTQFMRSEIKQGRQIYVVYPLIEESEKSDMKNLMNGFSQMKELFPEYSVSMVHGKMKPAEKDAAMQLFVSGQAQILVATTVIEVGVNVPNASVMVIENAERFGLSQLHQLRGRVGRGADQSYCVLVSRYELGADTRKRLSIMTETNDGFEIAEADLKLRGPGDLDGTMQSGLPFDLQIANLSTDGLLLQQARGEVEKILAGDPLLAASEHTVLLDNLQRKTKGVVNWSSIS
ncbi:MAG: ATP-dependent DNA helicase RecG [Paludibacteraceae bacterium]|nr:ATP-dependent DNA helicase RecG [Paludibacteraceae bacterium]